MRREEQPCPCSRAGRGSSQHRTQERSGWGDHWGSSGPAPPPGSPESPLGVVGSLGELQPSQAGSGAAPPVCCGCGRADPGLWSCAGSCPLPKLRGAGTARGAGIWEGKCLEMIAEPLPAPCAGSAGLKHLLGTVASRADPELFLLPYMCWRLCRERVGPCCVALLLSLPVPSARAIPQGTGCSLASACAPPGVLFYPFFPCQSMAVPAAVGRSRGYIHQILQGKAPSPQDR